MLTYNSEDVFSAEKLPEMVKELSTIKTGIVNMPPYFKPEIIISYLKNHCIKNDWIQANPELVRLLLSGCFVTRHIEAQFEFCRIKSTYWKDFEFYIKNNC